MFVHILFVQVFVSLPLHLHYDLGHFPFLFMKTWIDNLPSPILIPSENVLKHCTPSRLIYIGIYVNEI
jgi:hypothetical protein